MNINKTEVTETTYTVKADCDEFVTDLYVGADEQLADELKVVGNMAVTTFNQLEGFESEEAFLELCKVLRAVLKDNSYEILEHLDYYYR